MADVVFVVTTIAVFALVALVAKGVDEAVTAENIAGLLVAVVLLGCLALALIFPERLRP